MLPAHAMECSHYATANKGEYAFHGIAMNVGTGLYVLPPAMLHNFVSAFKLTTNFRIKVCFIGDKAACQVRVLCNEISKFFRGQSFHRLEANISAALHDAHYRNLVRA